MKIAVISAQAFTLLNFRGPLLQEMVLRGHEVIAFAPDFSDETKAQLQALGVRPVQYPLQRTGMNPIRDIITLFSLWITFRRHRPELVFSYTLKPVIYGTIAAFAAGIKMRFGLISGLGFSFSDDQFFSLKRKVSRLSVSNLLWLASRMSSKFFFQNYDDYNEAIAKRIAATHKVEVIGATGLDLQEWIPSPLPDMPVTFILIARLLRDKGVGEYIEAIRQLRASNLRARFILLGAIDENPAAFKRSDVQAWVDEGLVEWHGHVPVKPWIAQSHVFVLPSYYREGVPRSTQEAMAMGRAVITTDSPGCRDTVAHGQNGFLIAPSDAPALAAAMRQMIETPEIIAEMGKAGRKMAEERFDVHVQNEKLLQLMRVFSCRKD